MIPTAHAMSVPFGRASRRRSAASFLRTPVIGILVCIAAAAPQAVPAQDLDLSTIRAGDALAEALVELQRQGFPIVFTTGLVRPEMQVTDGDVIDTDDPLTAVNALLHPHGLAVRPGPGGRLTVVRLGASVVAGGSIRGRVLSRNDSRPIAGAVVTLSGIAQHQTSDGDGRFVFDGLAGGEYRLRFRRAGFVVSESEPVRVPPGGSIDVDTLLDPAPISAERLVVTPSHIALLREEPDRPLTLTRDDIETLPHLGGDLFRALSLLPGVSANDATAEFNLRGARRNASLVMLDGQELYSPYHLADFDNALSIVAPDAIGSIDLMTGAFAARYGDRMAGVLNIVTRQPRERRSTTVGLSVVDAHLGSTGLLPDGRGSWLAQARRGSIEFVGRLLGDGSPSFWDLFGKLDQQLTPGNALRGNVLVTDDRLRIREVVEDSDKDIATDYATAYLWLTHLGIVNPNLFVESAVSESGVRRDRRGIELEEEVEFSISDKRELEVIALRQDWTWQAGPDHALTLGAEGRWFDTEYDYFGVHEFDNPLADVRDRQQESTVFVDEFSERHAGLYLSDRIQATDSLTVDLGVRFDRHTQTSESLWSPRIALARAVGKHGVLRAAWGHFHQSQRPYELLVEDGDTTFYPVERAGQWVLGYERIFGPRSDSAVSLDGLRLEVYERRIDNPLPRFENLFEVLNTFPEVEPDRVRVEADAARARGAEIFLRGGLGQRTDWWLSWAVSSTDDRIDGRHVPRPFDQTHAVNLDLNRRFGDAWRVNLAWRYHTGWPTTPITVVEHVDEDGETVFVPELGERSSERFANYHRLDLRLSRHWAGSRRVGVEVYVDVQNLYDRRNLAGFDVEIDDEEGTIDREREEWAGILPSVGVSVEF